MLSTFRLHFSEVPNSLVVRMQGACSERSEAGHPTGVHSTRSLCLKPEPGHFQCEPLLVIHSLLPLLRHRTEWPAAPCLIDSWNSHPYQKATVWELGCTHPTPRPAGPAFSVSHSWRTLPCPVLKDLQSFGTCTKIASLCLYLCCLGCLKVLNALKIFTFHGHFDFGEEPDVAGSLVQRIR